jgi:hypothetical protein
LGNDIVADVASFDEIVVADAASEIIAGATKFVIPTRVEISA